MAVVLMRPTSVTALVMSGTTGVGTVGADFYIKDRKSVV